MNQERFQEENNAALEWLLSNRFFNVWADPNAEKDDLSLFKGTNLELYITSTCNQKCEYCYLYKHEDKLYPKQFRDSRTILKNLDILLSWFVSHKMCFKDIELFSGEIWHTQFGWNIFDSLLKWIRNGLVVYSITIPTNCTFAVEDSTMYRMQDYIDEFSSLGVRLIISCSIEGKVLEEDSRSFKDTDKNHLRDDRFYKKLFYFCKYNNYLFHPMVSAQNVWKWKENLDWFESELNEIEYGGTRPLMMLEVRNDDWTSDAIEKLLEFYDYEIEKQLALFNGNIARFADSVLRGDRSNSSSSGYCNYALPTAENDASCGIPRTLTIRLGDLALCPCHRLSYDNFLFGKFRVEDDKIVGIDANNLQMAIRVFGTNNKIGHHGCDTCVYNSFCMRGCFGAQFEYTDEPFMPIESVCNMFKAKFNHLIDKYTEMGVIDEWKKVPKYDAMRVVVDNMLEGIERINRFRGVQ